MLLMIDNYDSFTFNLVQYLQQLGQTVWVKRNDTLSVSDIKQMQPSHIVISPGPGDPTDAGISLEIVQHLGDSIPIFGVCLGHQVIAQCFGAEIVHARQVMHGKTSMIHHDDQHVFTDLPSPFEATRYHSLVVDRSTVPECIEINAWSLTEEGTKDEIMGLRHRTKPIYGVQFHPEAIFTEHGHQMLQNFLIQNADVSDQKSTSKKALP